MASQQRKFNPSYLQLQAEVRRKLDKLGVEVDVTGFTKAELFAIRGILAKRLNRQRRQAEQQQRQLNGCSFGTPKAVCYGRDPGEIVCNEAAFRGAF